MTIDVPHRIEISFEIQGKGFDPEEITQMLGIEPYSTQKRKNENDYSFWILRNAVERNETVDIGEMSDMLLQDLIGFEDKIIAFKEKCPIKIYFEVDVQVAPTIFSTNYNEKLNEINLFYESNLLIVLGNIGALFCVTIEA